MIAQNVYLYKWNWEVTVFYSANIDHLEEILDKLEEIGSSDLRFVEDKLLTEHYNFGLTYSNLKNRRSVIVIGKTTSPAEFQNTFDHEKGHLAMHICDADGIDPFSEEYQYLTGDIGERLFYVAKHFVCEHCREELKDEV